MFNKNCFMEFNRRITNFSFSLLESWNQDSGARLGRIDSTGRTPIHTPHYLGVSSRGCIPHLTPDMMRSNTAINNIYTAFEDCKENRIRSRQLSNLPLLRASKMQSIYQSFLRLVTFLVREPSLHCDISYLFKRMLFWFWDHGEFPLSLIQLQMLLQPLPSPRQLDFAVWRFQHISKLLRS